MVLWLHGGSKWCHPSWDNYACDIAGISTVNLQFQYDCVFTNQHVHHIPQLKKNFSTRQLDDDGFHHLWWWEMEDLYWCRLIARGCKNGTLYPLHVSAVVTMLLVIGYMSQTGTKVLSQLGKFALSLLCWIFPLWSLCLWKPTYSSIRDVCKKRDHDVMGIYEVLTNQFILNFSISKLYPINGISRLLWSKKKWIHLDGADHVELLKNYIENLCTFMPNMRRGQLCAGFLLIKRNPCSFTFLS